MISESEERKTTLIDTGCSAHVNADKTNRLINFRKKTELISLGDTSMKSTSQGRGDLGPLRNVMYAPGMSFNLISVSAMDKLGYVTVCAGGECLIITPSAAGSIVHAVSELEHGAVAIRAAMGPDRLYHVRDAKQLESALAASPALAPTPYTFAANRAEIKGSKGTIRDGSTAGLNALQLLHLRTAHSSKRTILAGLKVNAFKGVQCTYAQCKDLEIGPREGCMLGNMRADSIPVSHRTYSTHKPMQEVGIDPVPLSTTTIDGGSVANMGIDCVTKLMFCYEACTDGQQVTTMKKIQRDCVTPYGHKIDTVHTDSASYFVGCNVFQKHCLDNGIRHDASAPHNHAHNMVEGACIKVVMKRARVVLADAGLPPSFAVYAIRAATTTWNAMLYPLTATKTPYEQVTSVHPDVSDLRPFGALVYSKVTYLSERCQRIRAFARRRSRASA
jgi:hypothetical protein